MTLPLFCYGSLRALEVRMALLGEQRNSILQCYSAQLEGYQIRQLNGQVYPTLTVHKNSSVRGIVLGTRINRDHPRRLLAPITNEVLAIIDQYEGVHEGLYVRQSIKVSIQEQDSRTPFMMKAWVYLSGPKLSNISEKVWSFEEASIAAQRVGGWINYLSEDFSYNEAERG